jgi:hypothetical protein
VDISKLAVAFGPPALRPGAQAITDAELFAMLGD